MKKFSKAKKSYKKKERRTINRAKRQQNKILNMYPDIANRYGLAYADKVIK